MKLRIEILLKERVMGYVPEFDFSDQSKRELSDACRAAAKGARLPCHLEETDIALTRGDKST